MLWGHSSGCSTAQAAAYRADGKPLVRPASGPPGELLGRLSFKALDALDDALRLHLDL
ncbi:hypothetical protein AB2L28_12810 [Kineococcus sp. TBRC 1896]|uniref:Uncharacterized protein n=1 Tax=Kineococcus mangrovi TaxID=1660183 RepID=A0ABV4I364_9ACTN